MMGNESWKNVLDSETGFTLLEIMITLVIVCMFTIVITQFMGISFKDIFNKGNKMQATAEAQNFMEKVKAIAENTPAEYLDDVLKNGFTDEFVASEANLLVYNPASAIRFCYTWKEPDVTEDDSSIEIDPGINVSVVVFYNNGSSHVRINHYCITGKLK